MAALRRSSVQVSIATVRVGGNAPIVVQSMTNTDTADIEGNRATGQGARARRFRAGAAHRQHKRSRSGGRTHPPTDSRRWGVSVPLIGDFHFNGHKLLREHPSCAEALAKYRINPGT